MKKTLCMIFALLMLAAPLAACGKKAPPKPPSGESDYPTQYPQS